MTYTRTITVDWGVTGLTGTIGYTVKDNADNNLIARTTSGVTESPTGSGIYRANVASWDEDWVGRIVWDAGGSGVGSAATESFGSNTVSAEADVDEAAIAAEVVAALAGAVPINVIGSVYGQTVDIVRGDSYLNDDSRALTFTKQASESWPASIETCKFYCEPNDSTLDIDDDAASLNGLTMTVSQATGEDQSVYLELGPTTTASLTALQKITAGYRWWIVANADGTNNATLRMGPMIVRPDASAP